LFGGGEDLVEIDGDAEGDKEESPYAGADPIGGSEGRGCYELGPERRASRVKENWIVLREGR
jgi:hypothetical protein